MNDDSKRTAPAARWSGISRQLKEWSRPALLALVKDLYDASPENRHFLHARFQAEEAGGAALETYRRKIVEQFFPARGDGKLKLGEARKAIRDYRKATGNTIGTIDLLLTYVENGTEFTKDFGDINEAYYNSLESAAEEMKTLLFNEGPECYQTFRERIVRLEKFADHIGWGYGDYLRELIWFLENEFTDQPDSHEADGEVVQ